VGGVSTETIAEDFHSTIKLHRAGWTTRYHDEVLVQGIAPHDLDGYLLQRDRWARGNNLVHYCYVVHPCERLRESRLEAPERGAAVVPMSPVPPAANEEDDDRSQPRPTARAAGGRRP
jgi:hypothetical protein